MLPRTLPLWLILVMGCAVLASGCTDKHAKKDPFYEKWKLLAEESKGYSPTPSTSGAAESETQINVPSPNRAAVQEERALPTVLTTLRFNKANMAAVLQAMARAANLSVMISPGVAGEVSLNIKDMPWDQVFRSILRSNGLAYDWEGDILRIMTAKDIEAELAVSAAATKRQIQQNEQDKNEPLALSIVKLKYAKAEKVREDMEKLLTRDAGGAAPIGSIQLDRETNALIIKGLRADIKKIIGVLNQIDMPRKQIHIQAHIVEATKDAARALGTLFTANYVRGIGGKPLQLNPQLSVAPDALPSGATTGFGAPLLPLITNTNAGSGLGLSYGDLNGNYLVAQLQALQEDSKVNILSSPMLTTLDNEKAVTENGSRIPFVTLANNGGTITQTVQFIDAVLRLEIEPQIIDREYMRLKVIVKKDEPDPIKNVQGNPYIIKKDTETTLIVRTGQTVVLSGLTRTRNAVTDRGYPGFKDIPGIGWLGKTENKDDSLEEVLIFLTPQILPEPPLAAALRPAAAPVPAPVPAPALPEAALPATEEGRGQ